MPKLNQTQTAKLEICLSIDKEHPGQPWAKRYYVDEVTEAVEDHQVKVGWLETRPSIGFLFEAKDVCWIRLN